MSSATTAKRNAAHDEFSDEDRELFRIAQQCISESLDRTRSSTIQIVSDQGELPPLEVPPEALRLIGELLRAMSTRDAVTIVSSKREMTTVEAAAYLNVSRPFVIKEMEENRLPYRMVGSHRRVSFDDLEVYAEGMQVARKAALDKLAKNAEDLGLDY